MFLVGNNNYFRSFYITVRTTFNICLIPSAFIIGKMLTMLENLASTESILETEFGRKID